MVGLILQFFVDALMALLLVVTTVYCWRLNKRIKILQDSKSDLAAIISQFDISTQKATQSIAEIHEAAARIAENMQHKIDKANYIADDLQFMIEKGNKIADRMDGGAPARAASAASARSTSREAAPATAASYDASAKKTARAKDIEADDAKASKQSAIEEMITRAKRSRVGEEEEGDDARRQRRQGARLRSKAEQELFEALKTGGGNV